MAAEGQSDRMASDMEVCMKGVSVKCSVRKKLGLMKDRLYGQHFPSNNAVIPLSISLRRLVVKATGEEVDGIVIILSA